MEFSRIHFISCFILLLSNPSSASITFSLTNISPQNQNREIVIEGEGASISDGGIQLTGSDLSGSAGRATYITPLDLLELATFSTNFTFVIDSNGSTSYGYGLTFFLTENNSIISQGNVMGLPFYAPPDNATSRFVAVEFDTSYEYWDPIVGRGDPVGDHVGIDVSSVSSANSLKWLSNVTGGGLCEAWIRYDSVSKNLTVSFTGFRNGTAVRQDGLFYAFDLKKELPDSVIFGFSASTGTMFQRNTVRSWSFESSDLALNPEPPPAPSTDSLNPKLPPAPSPDSLDPEPLPSPSPDPLNKAVSSKVGFIVGLTVMISFLAVLAFVFWRRRRKKSRKDVPEETGFDVEMNTEFEKGIWPK
ncbi:hypothetical protein L1987_02001 [Smallanthus sonchifolius]|uniref:Uncharacterized protein n=1 Tax=Smallanthus sonchifolius TaxID=185202 RepID=A0ACB9K6K7_9ASTR|nr:hypothetical protein L1987_02001 [Smallanthus sonchifolius]